MKEQILELRVKIDSISQLTKELKPINKNQEYKAFPEYINSKEIENTYDSLILAKAWLGKVLAEMGESTPYVNDGKRKDVKDIEPTAETTKNLTINKDGGWEDFNHIQKVDWLRQEIEKIVDIIKEIYISNYLVSRELNLARDNAYNYLCESRFWLGFELQRIRENK